MRYSRWLLCWAAGVLPPASAADDQTVRWTAAAIAAVVMDYVFGEKATTMLGWYLMFVFADITTGVAKAFVLNKVSSRQYARGMVRKFAYMAVIPVAHIADHMMGLPDPKFRDASIMVLLGYEGLSVLENLAQMGLTFGPLRTILQRFAEWTESPDPEPPPPGPPKEARDDNGAP